MSATLPAAEPRERLAAEMAASWRRGECLPAEYYLGRHPELLDPPEGAVRLIYEEVRLRQERGEEVTAEEMLRRFPRWEAELGVMLDCHRLVREHLAPPQFPAVGETLGEFRLVAELGRGTQGRVFLAAQPALADRPVVLKVSPRQDREHLSLARLQHTHIIPLYGAHDFPGRNLRALCQPYLGSATLARLLDLMRDVPAPQRTGRSLVEALDRAGGDSPPGRGPRESLAKAPYAEAVCWVGAWLADALDYAHERGLVHLDLKPSNVLLAADGQPMLLDFHLALQPIAAGSAAPEGMGGTPECMSPEQRAAYDAARRGLPVPAAVDSRSDVYSLGRLLHVALGGEGKKPLHRCNPQVSVGLSDIVQRCLAADPERRYPRAAELAADLRRHLAGQPLCGVANRSLGERWRKWRRRRPHALLWAGVVLALAGVPALIGAAALQRWSPRGAAPAAEANDPRPPEFWAHFDGGSRAFRDGRHDDAVRSFTAAVALAPGCAEAYYNRALAHAARGDAAAARRDYDRALELAPGLAAAALNRGVLHYQQGRLAEALADLEAAPTPAAAHYNLALVRLARGERYEARESVARALRHAPAHAQALALRERLARPE